MRAFRITSSVAAASAVLMFLLMPASGRRRPATAARQTRTRRIPRRVLRTHTQKPRSQLLWTARRSRDGRTLELAYRGETWVTGLCVEVVAGDAKFSSTARGARLEVLRPSAAGRSIFRVHGPVSYDIVISSDGSSAEVSLEGFAPHGEAQAVLAAEVHAGPDAIQARIENLGSRVWQMQSGRATSMLNDSVYDRHQDQALRVLARTTRFEAVPQGFDVTAAGPVGEPPRCRLEMVDRVFSNRLPYYTPLDKKEWPHAPVGWCSWYGYFSHVTQQDILRNADALKAYYKPFGLDYCLVDAGWQHAGDGENGSPIGGNWDSSNLKFPQGMKWLADQIHARGLRAGLWLSVFGNADKDFYERHPDWFLHNAEGNAGLGSWFGTYVADFSNPQLENYLEDLYRRHTLDWGYDYFKLDGENGTLRLWALNRARAADPSLDATTAFRHALGLIRQAMNSKPGVFFSACGPAYPTESMGIAQSARLGGDVVGDQEPPSFRGVRTALEGMRRGYYTHNIAWYADPDALVVRPPLTDDEAQTWTSILGLSGQLLMLGDDMASLPTSRRELLRKIMPVADITPMDLFPIAHDRPIWMLHVVRAFASWDVAGIFDWDVGPEEINPSIQPATNEILGHDDSLLRVRRAYGEQMALTSIAAKAKEENQKLEHLAKKPAGLELLPVTGYLTPPAPRKIVLNFAEAGLDPRPDYLLFDFWNQKFLGKVSGQYSVILEPHQCRVISIRPAEDYPQLIGTDRHITMGGVEIQNEQWDAHHRQLRVVVDLVEHYPTTLTFYTAGWRFERASASGVTLKTEAQGEIVRTSVWGSRSGPRQITIQFK
jgi:Melibiase